MKKLMIHVLSNIKFYLHLTAILSYFLFSYLYSYLFGFSFLGPEDAACLMITCFFMEWHHKKNGHEMKALLEKIRTED